MTCADDPFACICCGSIRNKPDRWRNATGRDREIAPICLTCERAGSFDWTGRARHRSAGTAGSFMDRRNIMRGMAIADQLAAEANGLIWRAEHGRS